MKTKALISFAVTAKLICDFLFAYVKCRFSHDPAYISSDIECAKVPCCKEVLLIYAELCTNCMHNIVARLYLICLVCSKILF